MENQTEPTLQVLIIEDHSLIAEGLRHVLSCLENIANVKVATTGKAAADAISWHPYDLYICDLELPDMDGFDLIKLIQQRHKEANILINTVHDEIWTIKRLIECGVKGIIFKTCSLKEVEDAVQAILSGGHYLCSEVKKILSHIQFTQEAQLALTSRETEVLRYIAKGLNSKEIANQLCLSYNTVESHRKSLLTKLGAKNSIELVLKAINNGMYELL